jgi:cytochrome c oxidase cbb3-type subunit III
MSEPTQNTAPNSDEQKLLPHDFDGIREADNPPPLWFTLLFWGTVIWAVAYFLHYNYGPGRVGVEDWKKADVALQEVKAKHATGPLTEDQLRGLSTNPERIASGKQLYASAGCITCHGPETLGAVGPNLRDRYWIHGSSMVDIVTVIAKGAANNTMPAQEKMLSGDDINNLTIFLVSLNRAGLKDGKPADLSREKEAPIGY